MFLYKGGDVLERVSVLSLSEDGLQALLAGMGEPLYRARQLFGWLHQKQAEDFAAMTNIPAALKNKLKESCFIDVPAIAKKTESKADDTRKYLFRLSDSNTIETVLMSYKHGQSICISTQAGCRMGCVFCASGAGGLKRSLSPAEMLSQVYKAQKESGRRVSHVVLMGIGEPLDNLENVLVFLRILSSPCGMNMSLRNVSISTCGLADKIDELKEHKLGVTLSVSLHAPNDELRSKIMPVNKKYGIGKLLSSCKRYYEYTRRRVSFEYALIDGLNDQDSHAAELAKRLSGMKGSHVNLIRLNETAGKVFKRSGPQRINAFCDILKGSGINATVRRELGYDISAACGQLRRTTATQEGAL